MVVESLSRFKKELNRVVDLIGLPPARRLPVDIVVEDFTPTPGRCSYLHEDGTLRIPTDYIIWLDVIIRKEALSWLIPPEADSVPQVHDIAWAYAEAPRELWEDCRLKPRDIFYNYDPISTFSYLSKKSKLKVLKGLVPAIRAAALSGNLTFPIYLALLNRFVSYEVELTNSDMKVIDVLSDNPYATREEIRRKGGVSSSSISRSLTKLRKLGYIFGPQNVYLWGLGLTVLIASFPNQKKYREAFWNFKFTYNMMIPISGGLNAHAYIVLPIKGVPEMEALRDFGVEIGVVKSTRQRLRLDHPENVIESMVKAYLRDYEGEVADLVEVSEPSVRITKQDLRILNLVLLEGKVTSTYLAEKGIKSPKQRLNKLKRAGLIREFYMVEFPKGMDRIFVKVRRPKEELIRFTETLGSVATTIAQYAEGRGCGACLAIVSMKPEVKGDLLRGIKLIYGDDLVIADEVLDIHPSWYLPEELWDESKRAFKWENEVEKLIKSLER